MDDKPLANVFGLADIKHVPLVIAGLTPNDIDTSDLRKWFGRFESTLECEAPFLEAHAIPPILCIAS
jgi:hypothetical protein